VQNAAGRIVYQAPRRQHHSVDLLKDLRWLAVCGTVDYKIAFLYYKADRETFIAGPLSGVRASDRPLPGFFARYKFVTYLNV